MRRIHVVFSGKQVPLMCERPGKMAPQARKRQCWTSMPARLLQCTMTCTLFCKTVYPRSFLCKASLARRLLATLSVRRNVCLNVEKSIKTPLGGWGWIKSTPGFATEGLFWYLFKISCCVYVLTFLLLFSCPGWLRVRHAATSIEGTALMGVYT